jgi:eukaryotic-like serine/threonine-protein kinase
VTRSHIGLLTVAFASPAVWAAPALKDRGPTTAFVQWSNVKDFAANEAHNPLVVGDKVVVGTDRGELRAYRCKDGAPVWAVAHGKRIFHTPASDGERVYFSSAAGLTAVSLADGAAAWIFPHVVCDGPVHVLPKYGLVCVGGHDGVLYAVDVKTGKQKWTSDFIKDAPADPPGFSGERARLQNTRARPAAVASDGHTIYLSVFDQCRVVAVAAEDGKRRWAYQTGGWVYGAAVATDRHVFFGSQDQHFYAVDKGTGKEVWKFKTDGRVDAGGAVDETAVYFGSSDGGLYCVTQADAKLRWRFAADPAAGTKRTAIYSVPVVRGAQVCFAVGEGQAYGVEKATGKRMWQVRPVERAEMYCTAATDGSYLFVTTRAASEKQGDPALVAIGLK